MPIISGTDLATYLRIDDGGDSTLLDAAAATACVNVVEYCGDGRVFDKTDAGDEFAKVFRPASPFLVVVDDFWDITNLEVKSDDGDVGDYTTTWTITRDFVLEPFNQLRSGQVWPYYKIVSTGNRIFYTSLQNRPNVQVTAAWGWAGYPDPVVQATLIQAARIFRRRTSPEGIIGGFDQLGAVRVSSRVDPDVEALLAPYRRADAFGIA